MVYDDWPRGLPFLMSSRRLPMICVLVDRALRWTVNWDLSGNPKIKFMWNIVLLLYCVYTKKNNGKYIT